MQPKTMLNENLRHAIKLLKRSSSYVSITDICSNVILTFIAKNSLFPVFNSPVPVTFSFCVEICLQKLRATFCNLVMRVPGNMPTSVDGDNTFISGA
jgi:hypothetical protein